MNGRKQNIPLSVEEATERFKRKLLKRSEASFSGVVRLIETTDKSLGPSEKMGEGGSALWYTPPANPIYARTGHRETKVYGMVSVVHGRGVYDEFDFNTVLFPSQANEKSDFVTIKVPLGIVRAVVDDKDRPSIDSFVESEMSNIAKTAGSSAEADRRKSGGQSALSGVFIGYVLPNQYAFENYPRSRKPHVLVEIRMSSFISGVYAMHSFVLLPVGPAELIAQVSALNESLFNPKKASSNGKGPLQQALHAHILNYVLPEMNYAFSESGRI